MTKINYKSEGEIKACYEGKVRDKKPHGRGDLTFANGDYLDADFTNGSIRGKEGTFAYATGDTYTGEIDKNVPDGDGKYKIANSGRFEGEFFDGEPTKGIYKTRNGEYLVRYDGTQWWLTVDGKEVSVSSTRKQNPSPQPTTIYRPEVVCTHAERRWEIVKEPTCTEPGIQREVCKKCGKIFKTETAEAFGHNYVNGVCSRCGHHKVTPATRPYTRTGNTIYFGMYPQSEVTDSRLKATLTKLAGTLPTEVANRKWTPCHYYTNGRVSNFMWRIDIDNAGERYRGVYFTSYRPYLTTYSSSIGNSCQDDNGYRTSTVYWFKYEPIKWKILTEKDEKAFLLADIALDSREYHPSSNSYADSTIRKWLNDTFYNTAFNNLQKGLIQTTSVDNSVSSMEHGSNAYACANTSDKVLLLSYKEATACLTSDSARIRKSSDYAKSQGIYSYSKKCWWWLRSPSSYYSYYARYVGTDGSVDSGSSVDYTNGGVVPALWIDLSSAQDRKKSSDNAISENIPVILTPEIDIALSKKAFEGSANEVLSAEDAIVNTPSTRPYTRTGNTIYFGMYPQSEVTDSVLKATLTNIAGKLPSSLSSKNWTSYGYYINGKVKNFMWYIDIENDGAKYRGVYFTNYRPDRTRIESSAGRSHQDESGYCTSTVYWFKYEPIKWKILTESNGKAFLLADIALDSREYHPSSNNYADSTIRKWLNDAFYNTAFSDSQKESIPTTFIEDCVSATKQVRNPSACASMSDKVFLLSHKEVTTYLARDSERIRQSSDYAKSQGCWKNNSGACRWWLRSSNGRYSGYARSVCYEGNIGDSTDVDLIYFGVVPALWITL